MIYFFAFLKGAALALLLFGAFYSFLVAFTWHSLFLGAIPGFVLLVFTYLLQQNYELKEKLEKK